MCKRTKRKLKRNITNDNHEDVDLFIKNSNFFTASNEANLAYHDPFVTPEQIKRDNEITKLLTQYVTFYKQKVKHSTACRYMILIPCLAIICVFAGLLVYFALLLGNSKHEISAEDLVAFITACISFISLIIGLLTIITKYFFPENDEQYIANIVESIQTNDLENKRENAKNETQNRELQQ